MPQKKFGLKAGIINTVGNEVFCCFVKGLTQGYPTSTSSCFA